MPSTEMLQPFLTPAERAIVKSYGGWTHFMASFGLKPWEEDDAAEGKQILRTYAADSNEAIIYSLLWAAEATQSNQIPTAQMYKDFLRHNFGKAAALVGKHYLPSLFKPNSKINLIIASELSQVGYNTSSVEILLAMTQIITDSTYRCPAWYGAAQATRNTVPAWTYEFSHSSSCPWLYTISSAFVSFLGGSHTAELPFVFGNLDNSYLPGRNCNSTSAEWKLGGQMMDLWTAMAENGKPSTEEIYWPQFKDQGKSLTTPGLIFNNLASSATVDYTGCDLWIRVNEILKSSKGTSPGTPSSTPAAVTAESTASPSSYQFNAGMTLHPKTETSLILTTLFMVFAAL